MKPASSAHQSRPGATGGIPEPCPSQMTACAFPSEDCASKKFTGSGLLECKSRPKTRKLVLIVLEFASKNCFFVVFVDSHRISWNFGDEDLFIIIIFGLHLRIRGTSQNDYENLWTFLNWRSFFFNPHFRICWKLQELWDKNQSLRSSPFSFDPLSRIHINKFLVPPPKFVFAFQSRYPGPGAASVAYKLIFVILLYSPSCFGQETAKEPFGLRVKHGGVFTLSLFIAKR